MVYGLVHTAVDPPRAGPVLPPARPAPARTRRPPWRSCCSARSASSASAMMAAILPLLYVERGAQMTFVLQSCLLLVSGVYYSIDVLPPWMQVLSHLSPATYVLEGVRAGLDRWHAGHRAAGRRLAADRDGRRAHPVRPLGLRPRRALRQAHRQAQAGRLMMDRSRRSGWDPRWTETFAPFAAPGRVPRGSSPSTRRPRSSATADRRTVRRSCRAGSGSRRSRRPTSRPSATGSPSSRAPRRPVRPTRRSSRPCSSVGPPSAAAPPTPAVGPPATWPTSRSSRPTSTSRSSSPGSTATSTCAASSATWPSPGRAASTPVIVLNKADVGDRLEAPGWPSRPSPRASRSSSLSALTGDHLADLAPYLAAGPDRRRARVVGRRQVDPRQRPARRGTPGDGRRPRRRLARPPHDHAPRAVRAARRRAARRHPGHALARGRRGRRGRRDRLRRHRRARRRPVASATAATTASPAARSARPSPTAADADRLASQRKLERELAHTERKGDPRAQAEERRRWKTSRSRSASTWTASTARTDEHEHADRTSGPARGAGPRRTCASAGSAAPPTSRGMAAANQAGPG